MEHEVRLRILHVIAGVDREGGGTTSAVLSLAAAQNAIGCDSSVLATDSGDPKSQGHLKDYAVAVRIVSATGSWRYSSELIGELDVLLRRVDVVHVHGVWDFPPLAAIVAARIRGVPCVVSVHGMFSPEALRRSYWTKCLLRTILIDRLMERAGALIASGAHEAADLKPFNRSVCIVPHGVAPVGKPMLTYPREFGVAPKVGFLGRMHPFKGLDTLVAAAERLRETWSGLTLEMAGPIAAGFEGWVERLTCPRSWIHRRGTVSGDAKSHFLREIDVLVVASEFENFALVAGEALAHGTAVVTTDRTAWTAVAERGVGVVCKANIDSLQHAIETVLEDPEIRRRAATDGPNWIQTGFSWSSVAKRSIAAYLDVLGGLPANSALS